MYSLSSCSKLLQLNAKEDILKNVGNQTVAGSHWIPLYEKNNTMGVLWEKYNGYQQLFGYQHS